MPTKLKIKMGHIEFEYEGDAVYDNEAVKDLFSHIETLMAVAPAKAFEAPLGASTGSIDEDEASDDVLKLGVPSVAARLQVKTGSDVAMAAAAYLQICQGRDSFNRKELLATMRSAPGHFNSSMRSNLSSIIKQLIGAKRINSLANDRMSLAANEQITLRDRIAKS